MTIATRTTPAQAAALPLPGGRLSSLLLEADGIEVRHYAPKGTDPQTPHDRDELYFVAAGTATFERGAQKVPCTVGDMLFAAAGESHRFSGLSEDFAVWVVFYGPRKA